MVSLFQETQQQYFQGEEEQRENNAPAPQYDASFLFLHNLSEVGLCALIQYPEIGWESCREFFGRFVRQVAFLPVVVIGEFCQSAVCLRLL